MRMVQARNGELCAANAYIAVGIPLQRSCKPLADRQDVPDVIRPTSLTMQPRAWKNLLDRPCPTKSAPSESRGAPIRLDQ
jgi:hypothetical protein